MHGVFCWSVQEADEEVVEGEGEEDSKNICKVCGVDEDDEKTLLCDGCDQAFHIYCLRRPMLQV